MHFDFSFELLNKCNILGTQSRNFVQFAAKSEWKLEHNEKTVPLERTKNGSIILKIGCKRRINASLLWQKCIQTCTKKRREKKRIV